MLRTEAADQKCHSGKVESEELSLGLFRWGTGLWVVVGVGEVRDRVRGRTGKGKGESPKAS